METLLKKYRLTNIPKLVEVSVPSKVARPVVVRRKAASRKVQEGKTKVINKFPIQQKSLFYLVTRKIYSLLKQKEGLEAGQRREISSSLSK